MSKDDHWIECPSMVPKEQPKDIGQHDSILDNIRKMIKYIGGISVIAGK